MSEEININPEVEEEVENTGSVETDAPDAEVAAPPQADEKVHPAYEKLLSELPAAWHDKVIPHLQEQDKNFQQQLEKYTPLKEFLDYDPNQLRDSLKLADVAVNDPVSLYRNLAEHLRGQGLIEEAQAADEVADEAEESDDGDYEMDPAIKKEFDRRDAQFSQQEEYIQNMEYQKEVDRESVILDQQITEMTSKYDIPAPTVDRILKLMEVQLERGEDATVYTAARELAEITGVKYSVRGDLPKEDAPFIVGNGGGAGVPSESMSVPKDDKGKKQMLEQMFQAQLKGTANSL
jgi:hypothetical protein